MSKSRFFLALGAAMLLSSSAALLLHSKSPSARAVDPSESQRSFSFTYQVHVPADAGAKSSHLWIPLPQNDAFQSVSNLKIESSVPHTEGRDPEYQNRFAVFAPTAAQAAAGYDVTLLFNATRRDSIRRRNSISPRHCRTSRFGTCTAGTTSRYSSLAIS